MRGVGKAGGPQAMAMESTQAPTDVERGGGKGKADKGGETAAMRGGDAADGVAQLQESGAVEGGGKGKGKKHGKHGGKPGWGNGGSGPPGLMRRQAAMGGGGGCGMHEMSTSDAIGQMGAAPRQQAERGDKREEREASRVATANGSGSSASPTGSGAQTLRTQVQLDAVGGGPRSFDVEAGPARPIDDSLRRSVQLDAVTGMSAPLMTEPAPVAPQDHSLRRSVQLDAVGDHGADYGIVPVG